MVRARIDDFLASLRGRPVRLLPVLVLSVGLGGAASWFVAGAASASSPMQPPPAHQPPSTGPYPPPPTQPPPTQPPPTTPPPAGTTTPPRCTRAHLRLKFVDMQGATGHRYIDYAFKNVGSSSCSLRGYPRASLLNKSGHRKTAARAQVGHDPVSPVRTVVIKPGKRAFFTFTWVDGGFCPGNSFNFYGLRVAPPHDIGTFTRQFGKTPACGHSARVFAVRPKLRTF